MLKAGLRGNVFMRLPRLIINADDFGVNPAANAEVSQCLENGWITSATIMANGEAVAEAMDIAGKYPVNSFGVHLNLTEFRPLSGSAALLRLCDANGLFQDQCRSLVRLRDLPAIEAEWNTQIRRVRDSGLSISHIDSHHYIHTTPILLPALKAVQKMNAISRVRTTRNIIPRASLGGAGRITKLAMKYVWHRALVSISPRTVTTDLFGSVTDFVLFAKEVPAEFWFGKTIELMCHPGNAILREAQQEYDWIKQGLQYVVGFKFDKISYKDI
jgi:hypothetical protein